MAEPVLEEYTDAEVTDVHVVPAVVLGAVVDAVVPAVVFGAVVDAVVPVVVLGAVVDAVVPAVVLAVVFAVVSAVLPSVVEEPVFTGVLVPVSEGAVVVAAVPTGTVVWAGSSSEEQAVIKTDITRAIMIIQLTNPNAYFFAYILIKSLGKKICKIVHH